MLHTDLALGKNTSERLSDKVRRDLNTIANTRELAITRIEEFRAALEQLSDKDEIIRIWREAQAEFRTQYTAAFRLAKQAEPSSQNILHDCQRVDSAFDGLLAARLKELGFKL